MDQVTDMALAIVFGILRDKVKSKKWRKAFVKLAAYIQVAFQSDELFERDVNLRAAQAIAGN